VITCTQQFQGRVVERSRSQRFAAEEHWNEDLLTYSKCCQITVRNANNLILLRYSNFDKHKYSWTRLQCIFTSRFCDYRWPGMVYSRKTHLILCLPGIFRSNLDFWVSPYGIFQKMSLAVLDFASIDQSLRNVLVVIF